MSDGGSCDVCPGACALVTLVQCLSLCLLTWQTAAGVAPAEFLVTVSVGDAAAELYVW
jgi:hypothetical protein